MAKLTIYNHHEHTMTIQVDPSANTYYLSKGEFITFILEGSSDNLVIDYFDYSDDFRALSVTPDDYYIERNGTKYHCDEYPGD